MTELVQAWNGKWHIFERDLHKVPAKPVDKHNRIAKPERQIAVTGCGLQVFVKNNMTVGYYRDLYEYFSRVDVTGRTRAGRRLARQYCKSCLSVLQLRHPIGGPAPGPTDKEIEETRTGLLGMLNET